jgi:hypothetical protein
MQRRCRDRPGKDGCFSESRSPARSLAERPPRSWQLQVKKSESKISCARGRSARATPYHSAPHSCQALRQNNSWIALGTSINDAGYNVTQILSPILFEASSFEQTKDFSRSPLWWRTCQRSRFSLMEIPSWPLLCTNRSYNPWYRIPSP